ncbi:MAG: DUF1298 domain-containing protein [Fuerstiella sp.]|nr:DUF1298 domain-containing protein [Fuerstiella sp.]MCP4853569.1 DUF1298 domain-containing protein [Fuerstiella sp.]
MQPESQTNGEERDFPLPLAPFEAYMLADHRDVYPMHFYFRMVLRGHLEREPFTQSLTESIRRHPLLRAKVRPRFGRSPVWESAADVCIRECDLGFEDLSEVLQARRIDLTTEAGLRTWLFKGPLDTQLLFEFHHSCCDGLGALIFLEDVLLAYHRIVAGTAAADRACQNSGLATRAAIPLTARQKLCKMPLDVRDFFRISFRRPAMAAMAAETKQKAFDRDLSAYLSHQSSSAELTALLAAARMQGTTLNNILMTDVYRSLDQWMSQCGDSGHRWIRMAVPASIRADSRVTNTCCNQVTIMFLDQHSSDIRNSDSLLDRVTKLTRFHRESNIWYSMLQLLDALAAVPLLMHLYLRTNRRMCTTVLSNVGRAFESCSQPRNKGRLTVGDMQLTSLNFLSPLRPGTDVTFGVVTYAGSLSLSMHYKPHRIPEIQARKLFDLLVRNLQQSARTGSPVS